MDFSYCYLNKEVGSIKQGDQFGELALENDWKRQASIFVPEASLFAYIDSSDYKSLKNQLAD